MTVSDGRAPLPAVLGATRLPTGPSPAGQTSGAPADRAEAVAAPTRRDWAGLVVIALAVGMVIVDITIVNVAMPQIINHLDVSATTAQWVQEAYTVTLATLLLPFGRVADRYGRRRVLLAGVLVFAAASLLAAVSATGGVLVAARAVQGVAAAAIFPTTLSLINARFRGRYRTTAFAIWGSTIGGMAALGPLAGGVLTTELSWRWAFGVNLPVCAVVVGAGLLFVRESRDRSLTAGTDFLGVLLSVVAVGLLVLALIEGRTYGWWSPVRSADLGPITFSESARLSWVPVAILVAITATLGLLAHEQQLSRRGRGALVDWRLFAIRSFTRGNLVALLVALGEFGVLFALPLWAQNVGGRSAARTGVLLLPMAVAAFAAGGAAAALAARRGPLLVVRIGLVLEVGGIAGLAWVIGPDTSGWRVAPMLAVYGFGVGLATAQLPGLVLRDVPEERSGQASGTETTAQQIGSALGVAVLGTVLFSFLHSDLTDRLDALGLPREASDPIVQAVTSSAGGAINGLPAQPQRAAVTAASKAAFSDATRVAAGTAAAFLLIGLAASASLTGTGTVPAEPARPRRDPKPKRALPHGAGEVEPDQPWTWWPDDDGPAEGVRPETVTVG